MNFLKNIIWPWTRFADYEWRLAERARRIEEIKKELEFHRTGHTNALLDLQKEKELHEVSKNGLRHVATTLALRGNFDRLPVIVAFMLACFSGFSQVIPTMLTTNPTPILSSITGPMISTNGSSKPEMSYNAGALTNINDILLQSSGWVPLPWGGPSNAFPTVYSPISNAYFFYTTTTPVSITNMPCIAGTNTWATLVISNQTANLITQYCTVPGARIYGNPWAGGASNAVIIQPGKTCITSGWGTSTLMTNFAIQQQDN